MITIKKNFSSNYSITLLRLEEIRFGSGVFIINNTAFRLDKEKEQKYYNGRFFNQDELYKDLLSGNIITFYCYEDNADSIIFTDNKFRCTVQIIDKEWVEVRTL